MFYVCLLFAGDDERERLVLHLAFERVHGNLGRDHHVLVDPMTMIEKVVVGLIVVVAIALCLYY